MRITTICASMAFMQIAGLSLDNGWLGVAMANLICSIGAMALSMTDP
jgi:hypothetical protein